MPCSDQLIDPDASRLVRAAWSAGRLAHTWLVSGEDGIGKNAFAEWMVRLRWCDHATDAPCGSCGSCRRVSTGNHPDLVVVERNPPAERDPAGLGSKHEITVGQVRELVLGGLGLKAVEGRGRAVIIRGAEDLNEESQNALLKLLEEPPRQSLLVLVTAREESLLDTVRSRCHELRLAPLEPERMAALAGDADPLLLDLARGRPGRLPALARISAQRILEVFDALCSGRLSGAAFAREAEALLQAARDAGSDESAARSLLLELLHQRLLELALEAAEADGPNLGSNPASRSEMAFTGNVCAMESAIMQAYQDLRRHLPEAVSLVALGQELDAARMGA